MPDLGLLPRRGARLLPLLSAGLLLASFPPLHLGVPPFVALVPVAVLVAELPPGADGAGTALRAGLLLGAVYFGLLLHWLVVALFRLSPVALPGYLSVVAVLAALVGLVVWALHRLHHGLGLPLWVALPLAWTAGEWLRAHLPGGLAFPWLGLGTSLTGYPELVGIAEVVGARGVTFWLAGVSGLGAGVLVRWRRGRSWKGASAAAILAAVLPAAWGVWRADTLRTRPAARVAFLQPDVPAEVKEEPIRAVETTRARLDGLLARIDAGEVDLVVTPETAFPVALEEPRWDSLRAWLRAEAREVGAPILVGAHGTGTSAGGEARRHNSAFLVGADGLSGYAYHKRRLVPVVETAPAIFGGVPGPAPASLASGRSRPLATIAGGARFGTLICYESAFPAEARAYRRAGADFLVNITNDAWYGGERWYTRTAGLWQHPAHLVMRAVETRTGVVRAANAGISMLVDPSGRVRESTDLFEEAVRVGDVRTTDVRTFYVRYGDVAGTGSVAAVLVLLLLGARRERRRPASGG